IFISHRLGEVKRCADRVVVLRDGKTVGELKGTEIEPPAMIRLMIGRDLKSLYIPPAAPPGAAALELVGLRTSTYPAHQVSLAVHAGEILGLAGLVGSGRTELARVVFGIDRPVAGSLRLNGAPVAVSSPREAIERGIYLIPEDRKKLALLLDVSLTGNISLPDLRSYARATLISTRREAANTERQRERLKIKTPGIATEVGILSGGNQQHPLLP